MAAGDELRGLVAAVVDQRFLQRTKTRSRIGRDVFKAQGLDHIDHEIGPGTANGQYLDLAHRIAFLWRDRHPGRRRGRQLRRCKRSGAGGQRGNASGSGTFQEFATINQTLRGLRHGSVFLQVAGLYAGLHFSGEAKYSTSGARNCSRVGQGAIGRSPGAHGWSFPL